MTFTALLVCVDEAAAAVLRGVLEELSIQVESCPDFVRAAVRLEQDRFDVVIVDGESNAQVIQLLRETRVSRLNDSTLAVAVVAGQDAIREMFSLGVNFVLYKPVAYDRAMSSLRAARSVMRKEKRKSGRAAVHAHAIIDYANVQQEKATLVDLSADGIQVTFGKKLPPTSKVYFTFKLPGQNSNVRLSGQLVWQAWNGRGGIQFIDVPKASRRLLTEFLDANLPAARTSEQFADVTVEMEDPLPPTVSVPEQTHSSAVPTSQSLASSSAYEAVAIAGTAPASTSGTDDRRTQTRHSCRIGAEVYRIGTSVPNHCCLTDLSSGGCYLEVSLPFPKGSSVEIVVRTHELKLRLSGLVQAAHPGYGMGIAFEMKTKEEQMNVKKLNDYVAATSGSN